MFPDCCLVSVKHHRTYICSTESWDSPCNNASSPVGTLHQYVGLFLDVGQERTWLTTGSMMQRSLKQLRLCVWQRNVYILFYKRHIWGLCALKWNIWGIYKQWWSLNFTFKRVSSLSGTRSSKDFGWKPDCRIRDLNSISLTRWSPEDQPWGLKRKVPSSSACSHCKVRVNTEVRDGLPAHPAEDGEHLLWSGTTTERFFLPGLLLLSRYLFLLSPLRFQSVSWLGRTDRPGMAT